MGAGHRAPGGRLGILGPVTRAEPRSGRRASGDGDVGAGDADGNICLRASARGRVCCQNTDRFQSQNWVVGARPRPQDAAPPGGSLAPAPSPVGTGPRQPARPGGRAAAQGNPASPLASPAEPKVTRAEEECSGRPWGGGSRCSLAGWKDRHQQHLCGAGPRPWSPRNPAHRLLPGGQPPPTRPRTGRRDWRWGRHRPSGQRRVNSAMRCWQQPHK